MEQKIGIVLLMIACSLGLTAQDKPEIEKEKAAVKQAALDYAEGYYEGSGERMERAVHPLLYKRGLVTAGPQGDPFLVFMNSAMLIEAARSGRGKTEPEKRNISVAVLDLNQNTATVKIFTVQFNDYLHLAKIDGSWRIVNVLWRPPVQQASANPEKERVEVNKALTEYLEASNAKDVDRMKQLIHPEIIRRTAGPASPGGKLILQDLTGETVLQVVRMGRAAISKDQPQPETTILDTYEGMASVKLSTPTSIEYLHLAKQNSQWRIVNILKTILQQPAVPTK